MLSTAALFALLSLCTSVVAAPMNATATATSLLSVPTYATATSGGAFETSTAKSLAQYLPGYTYNLTEENQATRVSICNQTTAFCSTSKCTKSGANVTTNFCNPDTMGWNCECNDGADSRLQPLTVPVNVYDCRLRTAACLDQCSNPKASPPVASEANCKASCNYILGSTCGTSNQVLPLYQVKSYNSKPKYYSDTSKGGVAMGISAARFHHESEQAQAYNQLQNGEVHEGSFGHEFLAGAAAFAAERAYEQHVAKNGKPPNHQLAKELFAGFAAAEADKLIETKGLDFIDREKAQRQARQQAEQNFSREAYENNY
ncbi:hypothetical protein JCM3766R1_005016 [Sporobolomyces carnicolor]